MTNSANATGIDPAWTHSRIASKGAAESVAPFAFWLLLLPIVLGGSLNRQALAAACPADHTSERVPVAYIFDGDTVKLKDGRRVRFIGINTPEIGHHDKPVQPLARAARTSLARLLDANDSSLLLQHGQQQYDHYGRVLAHAFLENGENIAARLLRQGLATTLVVPPNTWGEHCYQAIEDSARAERLGLWALEDYQSQDARSLLPDTRGFRIVNGRVTAVRRSRHNTWLDLEGLLTVQIPLKKLASFSGLELDTLTGQRIEVRGWIRADGNKLKLKVQHQAALVIITTLAKP